MTTYHLEYFRPVRRFPGEIFASHDFPAASDAEAADKILRYIGAKRNRHIEADGTPKYPRVFVCLNRSSGRQIALPWEWLYALSSTPSSCHKRPAAA